MVRKNDKTKKEIERMKSRNNDVKNAMNVLLWNE